MYMHTYIYEDICMYVHMECWSTQMLRAERVCTHVTHLINLLFFSFTWVVNPGLNDVIQSKSTGRLFAPQPVVHGSGQHLGHVVVVLAEVRVLLVGAVVHLHLVVRVTERHG